MNITQWQERMRADVQGLDKSVHMANEIAELRDTVTRLEGEAGVMRDLLREALGVLDTLEPEDDGEYTRLRSLQKSITAIVDMRVVHK